MDYVTAGRVRDVERAVEKQTAVLTDMSRTLKKILAQMEHQAAGTEKEILL